MKLPSDFKELLEEFAREGVEHVVIGGYAFAYHAEPRATKDLDILLQGSEDNRERAARARARYGAPDLEDREARTRSREAAGSIGRRKVAPV